FLSAVLYSLPHLPVHFSSFSSPATPALYPLSLHDALPISWPLRPTLPAGCRPEWRGTREAVNQSLPAALCPTEPDTACSHGLQRSEEHTSELQSRENLVCRLLLEKKKNNRTT